MKFIRNTNRTQRQRGYVLNELVLAVAIIVIASGAGFVIYKTLAKDTETSSQINGIVDFLSKSKETFGLSGGNWNSFSAANMIKLNRIPSQFTKDATKIYDANGNEVVFKAPAAAQGTVSFLMRSSEECAKITQAVAELSYIASVGASGSESSVKTATTKLDIDAMATGCAVANRVLTLAVR
ncbi:hypothetical protein [Delftia sp. GW456-R20]|uniref:hypothetical protein n=1 Tax=Delftia sp. GW456-R20 TaxID=1827145 RepID=UPI000AF5E560|nr:hypothetical protein [Delftia sp. GW456-R20]